MPKTDISKSEKRAAILKRNIEALVKKPFGVGDHLKTVAEVAAMPKGTRVKVEEVRNKGMHFSCLCLDGPRSGDDFLISAEDLELHRSKEQQEDDEKKRLKALEG